MKRWMPILKRFAYTQLSYPASYIALPELIRLAGQNIFLPFYHTVGEEIDLPHIRHLYPIRNVQRFEADLDFLLKHFHPISLEELFQKTACTEAFQKPSFFLSFDDGLREINDVIVPILKRKGIPATFFLNTSFVDNQDLFFRYKASLLIDLLEKQPLSKTSLEAFQKSLGSKIFHSKTSLKNQILNIRYEQQHLLNHLATFLEFNFDDFLKKRQPYLHKKQIIKLQKEGFTFGNHSADHPLYTHLSLTSQLTQTRIGSQFLAKEFKPNQAAFAFPFTDAGVGSLFFNKARKEGLFDISFGTAGLKIDTQPFHFQRFPMERFAWKGKRLIQTEYLYFLLKRFIGKDTFNRFYKRF